MYNLVFPEGTKIVYTIQKDGIFFEVNLPKNEQSYLKFEDNLIKAILELELRKN